MTDKEKIIELEKKVNTLTQQMSELREETQLVLPLDVVSEELIRNSVVESEDTATAKTETLTVSAAATPFSNNYTVVKQFDGLLVIKWKNKFYKVGYYN